MVAALLGVALVAVVVTSVYDYFKHEMTEFFK